MAFLYQITIVKIKPVPELISLYLISFYLSTISFSELCGDEDDCRKMFKMMKSSHIGLHHPEFFLHWADFELKADRRDKSLAVLASANDTPIMRGNPQIKEAKEFIESDGILNLDVLFTLNTKTSVAASTKPPANAILPNYPLPLSIDLQFSDKFRGRPDVSLLGPAKRVKEDNGGDKENQQIDSALLLNHTGQSNNSNMSLTMTELNILKPTPTSNTQPSSQKEPEDTGTYNLTNNTLLNTSNLTSKTQTNSVNTQTLKSRQVRVNGKIYRVLQLIGRGGSSKVFRVIDAEGQIFALKKVNLKNLDEVTLASYTNEISLLKSFANNAHIIQLIDSEMNKEQACLYILMEYGEIDLGKMLKNRVENGFIGDKADENFIRFSFQQVQTSYTGLLILHPTPAF